MDLVTGGSGHIGNVLVRQLLRRGVPVRALLRGKEIPPALQGLDLEIIRGDILQPESLKAAMDGVDIVYHLAAKISLAAGADPEAELVNLKGTHNVIEAVQKAGVKRLVYASSIYALKKPAEGQTIDERQSFEVEDARGAYDVSKARASLAILQAVQQGLNAVIVCPTAVVGPYDFHGSDAGRAIRLYMRPGIKFIVEGAYDFVDVRDVAQGTIAAAQKGRRGETYILSGERMKLGEVVKVVGEAAGTWRVPVQVPLGLAYFAADLLPLYSRISGQTPFFTRYSLNAVSSNSRISHAKASRELGFTARPAVTAIQEAVGWFQAREEGKVFEEIATDAAG